MDETHSPIAAEVSRRMKLLGLNQKSLAVAAGVNETYVRDILIGKSKNPKMEQLSKVASALGCTVHDLRGPRPLTASPSIPEFTPDEGGILEMDTLAGLGSGGEAGIESWATPDDGIISAEQVKGVWVLPDDYLKGELGMTRKRTRIIEVKGDSMEPTLFTSDRVMLDLLDRVPSPPGLFGFFDGWGTSVKRLEIIPRSDPPAFKAICDNKHHNDQTYTYEEANIIGRVVWVARKI